MASKTITLEIIDFSQLRDNWESVKQQVQKALEKYGCFEALYDDIPQNLQKSVFDGLKQLFDLPLPVKLRNLNDNCSCHGYIGQHAMVPLYESLGIVDADTRGKIESFTNLLWPEGNPEFSKSIESFSEKAAKLDKIVRRMVVESYGLEKYMNEHIESTHDIVRVNKYDAPHTNDTKLGLSPHTDQNILTILCQNQVNGLKILTKDSQWFDSNPSPDSLIVMAGESFHAWTNGRVHAAQHRVMMEGDVDRYSIGYFSIPNAGYIIKAPEEMVDEEHPLLFKPYDNSEYLKFFYADKKGQTISEPLKAYCGV